jgi:succinyl-CoA synthetase beta subunit
MHCTDNKHCYTVTALLLLLLHTQVLLMERMYMRREMYLSIMMDRASQGPVIVACASGGTSIEDLAEESPELILKERIDINKGLTAAQAEKIAQHLQLAPGTPVFKSVSSLLHIMHNINNIVCAFMSSRSHVRAAVSSASTECS